jgi:hypothetical protein
MVPSETNDNFILLFLHLKASEIQLDNMALFANRG